MIRNILEGDLAIRIYSTHRRPTFTTTIGNVGIYSPPITFIPAATVGTFLLHLKLQRALHPVLGIVDFNVRDLHVALAELVRLGKERAPTTGPAEALERLEVVAEKRVNLLAGALT